MAKKRNRAGNDDILEACKADDLGEITGAHGIHIKAIV